MNCCKENKDKIADTTHSEHNHHQGEHGATHNNHAMSHGSAGMFLKRFWIVTVLLIPLAMSNESIAFWLGFEQLFINQWLGFGIATVIFGFSLIFFQHAWHEIQAKQYGMMTLVSTAVASGYIFSSVSTFLPALETEFYLEISTLIWVLLFGHYLEAKSSASAGTALEQVAKLLPQSANLVKENEVKEIPLSELKEGDVVLVKSGERIPADGQILEGKVNMDESLISGESKPVSKTKGEEVVAGSIVLDGSVKIKLTRTGEGSTVGQIQQLIRQAENTKPKSQALADKAAGLLTFIAAFTALATLLIWFFVLNESFAFAITLAITVLVIACPHALGLAIPTVTTITTSLAAKNGLLIKDLSKIETIKKVDYVVFDKTGTITEGHFGVTEIEAMEETTENHVLTIAASLGALSSHSIDIPIVEQAKKQNLTLKEVNNLQSVGGRGIKGEISGQAYFLGNKAFIEEESNLIKEAEEILDDLVAKQRTAILLANKDMVLGIIGLADNIRPESREAISALHKMGIKVGMLTGDNSAVAKAVAQELAIDKYFAEVLPEDKYRHIQQLQEKNHVVLMVGDGINDAPALTQADVGVAIGAGTDVAVEAGSVVLVKNNPMDVIRLIKLSKRVYIKMIQNLIWALGYNVLAIPAAAGLFASWGFFLRPELGALVMSLSTVIVVLNALTLKRIDLKAT